jgi:hypothetical protein
MTFFANCVSFKGMAISSVTFWPFPATWNYFLIAFNDIRLSEIIGGDISVNRERG